MSHRVIVAVAIIALFSACAGHTAGIGPAQAGIGGSVSIGFDEGPVAPVKDGGRARSTVTFPVPDCPGSTDVGSSVSTVCEDRPAPFSGVLISPTAAAKLIAELEACPAKCDEAARHAKEECEATCAYERKVLQAQLKAEQEARKAQVLSRDKQIDALSEQLASERDAPVWLWVSGGAVGGAALVIIPMLLLR